MQIAGRCQGGNDVIRQYLTLKIKIEFKEFGEKWGQK
jgi:hypothetical protein